jgi:hypothetical protein
VEKTAHNNTIEFLSYSYFFVLLFAVGWKNRKSYTISERNNKMKNFKLCFFPIHRRGV